MSKVALITGTNSGIGYSLALEFHKRGVKVYATDYQFSNTTLQTFKDLGIITYTLDVRNIQDIKKIRDIVDAEENGKLDYLYNNAGIVTAVHSTDITDEQLQDLYDINVFGPIKMTREFIKLVINAKAALDQYISVLQLEVRNYGVKVIEVLGGMIKTDIFNNSMNTVPDDSIYNFDEYTKIFQNRKQALDKNNHKRMPADIFAKRVLDQVEKSGLNTFRIFEGGEASRLYYIPNFLPRSKILDIMLGMFNLNFNYRKHLPAEKI
ncbi:unnamed protein product [Wickerhamomyces anomalus]